MLKAADETISFPIDENTKTKIFCSQLVTDKETGKEYFTFQNLGKNEILFYGINSQKLEFRIRPEVDGANGIGFLRGYIIKNLDSIFVGTQGQSKILLINKEGELKDKFSYNVAEDGKELLYSALTTYRNRPIVFIDNKMYIISTCDRWADKKPATSVIDLKEKSVEALYGFEYPTFPKTDNKAKKSGKEGDFSRCFDGKQFVYSFYFSEDIYVCSIDHTGIRKINAKSKYIPEIGFTDDYGNLTFKDIAENPNYGNLIYDPYRDVYYRVAYPKVEIEHDLKSIDLLEYGGKRFSIIIFDKDLNIVGETLFPDYTYNSFLMFIREDGLYISSSHFMNPNYSDDILSFQRFELVQKS